MTITPKMNIKAQKNKTFDWGEEQENAFQTLKDKLCNAPVQTLPDRPEDFMVYCDASGLGLGYVLMQRVKPKRVRAMNMTFQSIIKDRILAAQKEASDESAGLQRGDVRTMIMDEAHKSKYSVYPGADNMYYDIRDRYWWSGLKKDIAVGSQDVHLLLVEFSYNNSYHSSVRCVLFEAFYGRKCRSSIMWVEIREGQLIGPELVQEIIEKISYIKDRLKVARDRKVMLIRGIVFGMARVVVFLACTVFGMAKVVVLLECTVFGMQGLWSCPSIVLQLVGPALDTLTKRPKEILATELQLQLPPCPPMIGKQKKENLDSQGSVDPNPDKASGLLQRIIDPYREGGVGSNIRNGIEKKSFGHREEPSGTDREEGKFLGYMVTSEGIRENPKKKKAVSDMQSPKTLKDVKKFKGKAGGTESTSPILKETLYVYLAASRDAISSVLLAEQKGKHAPICRGGAYNITYVPHNAIKGKVLADFLNETPVGTKHMEKCTLTDEEASMEEWILYTDGESSLKAVGAGLMLIDPSRVEYTYAIRLNFPSTNNEAKYEALLTALRIAQNMKVQALKVKVDSKLVACQLNVEFVASSEGMTKYLSKAKEHMTLFKKFSIQNIPRNQNQKADVLIKLDLVAFNHLKKEMEAKPLAKTTGKQVKNFVWENIICRFGLPRVTVTNNETQLVNDPFKSWCERFKIKQMNTAVAHPQTNGLVERVNKSLMHGIKARLGRERRGWVDELPNILWAHQTMLKMSNGEPPFSLTHGSEAVIPTEIGMPTYRTLLFNEAQNEEEMRLNLDHTRKERDNGNQGGKKKKRVEQYYNKRVSMCPSA
nr:Pol polyprotein [Tanacetum cinerariifolium]